MNDVTLAWLRGFMFGVIIGVLIVAIMFDF